MITCMKCHETLTTEDYMDECEYDNSIHKWVHKCYNPMRSMVKRDTSQDQEVTYDSFKDMFMDFEEFFGGSAFKKKDDENGKDE